MRRRILFTICIHWGFVIASDIADDYIKYDIVVGSLWYMHLGFTSYGFQGAVEDAVSTNLSQLIEPSYATGEVTNHTLILWEEGYKNCTAACLDPQIGPEAVWNQEDNGATLHNCMVFPWIMALWSAGRLTSSAVEKAKRFGITNSTNLLANDRWPIINACTKAYCELSSGNSSVCLIEPRMTAQANYQLSEPIFNRAFWTLVSIVNIARHDALYLFC